MSAISVTKTRTLECEECGKMKRGVSFFFRSGPYGDPGADCFLCWEHFRLAMETMIDAGVVERQPDKVILTEHCCRCLCSCARVNRVSSFHRESIGESSGR